MLLIRGPFCWTRAFNEEDNNLCFENCASTFFKKVYEFVDVQVDGPVRGGMRLLSNASSGMRHYFAPRFALQNNAAPCGMRWKATSFRP